MIFGTGLDGTGTTVSSGSIGIGTSTPGNLFNERLTVSGDTYFEGNSTTTGNVVIGNASGLYARIWEVSLGALGSVLTIDPEGSGGGLIGEGAGIAIRSGLNVLENEDSNQNPAINFLSDDIASTFNIGTIEFATTTELFNFSDNIQDGFSIVSSSTNNILTFLNGTVEAGSCTACGDAFFNISSPNITGTEGKGVLSVRTGTNDAVSNTYGLFVDTNARVGIGTTTPDYLLDITSSGFETLRLHRDLNNVAGGVWSDFALDNSVGEVTTYARLAGIIEDNTNGAEYGGLSLRTMSNGSVTEALYIDGSNDIGIGTAVPDVDLHVSRSDTTLPSFDGDTQFAVTDTGTTGNDVEMSIVSGNNANAILNFGDQNNEDVGYIDYDHSNNTMNLGASAATLLTLDGVNGYVGIGTTTPERTLSVYGGGGIVVGGPTTADYRFYDEDGGTDQKRSLMRLNDDDWSFNFQDDGQSGSGVGFVLSRQSSFKNRLGVARFGSSAAPALYVDVQSAEVGINTNAPAVELHVLSTSDTDIFRLEDSDGTCNYNPESGSVSVSCSSDASLKTNIVDINASSTIADLMKYRIREYDVIASGDTLIGVVAQELQEDLPDRVSENEDGLLMVEMPNMWEILVAVQEVWRKITGIEDKIVKLEQENQLLKERLDALDGGTSTQESSDEEDGDNNEEPDTPETNESPNDNDSTPTVAGTSTPPIIEDEDEQTSTSTDPITEEEPPVEEEEETTPEPDPEPLEENEEPAFEEPEEEEEVEVESESLEGEE